MTEWWKSLNVQTQISVIVVLVSIVSLIINTFVNLLMKKKDIKANIVSKARIEWISEVRILIAKFMKQVNKINRNILHSKDYVGEELKKVTNEIEEDILELNYNLNIITLYFSDNEENKKVIDSLKKVYDTVFVYHTEMLIGDDYTKTENAKNVFETLKKYSNDSILICRIYLKNEWKKSKEGK